MAKNCDEIIRASTKRGEFENISNKGKKRSLKELQTRRPKHQLFTERTIGRR